MEIIEPQKAISVFKRKQNRKRKDNTAQKPHTSTKRRLIPVLNLVKNNNYSTFTP